MYGNDMINNSNMIQEFTLVATLQFTSVVIYPEFRVRPFYKQGAFLWRDFFLKAPNNGLRRNRTHITPVTTSQCFNRWGTAISKAVALRKITDNNGQKHNHRWTSVDTSNPLLQREFLKFIQVQQVGQRNGHIWSLPLLSIPTPKWSSVELLEMSTIYLPTVRP